MLIKRKPAGLFRGPGIFITAAFIGPGTVTVCSMAGAGYGFDLVWVLVFSVVATIILQTMAVRLGSVTGRGIGLNIRQHIAPKVWKYVILGLIIVAIILGNTAYEAGNISGAALGLGSVLNWKEDSVQQQIIVPLFIGFLAAILLLSGSYKVLKNALLIAALIMSLAFLSSAIILWPSIIEILKGIVPSFPSGSGMMIIALVGTTLVPYNLFLHASLSSQRSAEPILLHEYLRDAVLTIAIGGCISLAILITAAASGVENLKTVMEISEGLQRVFGPAGKILIGMGFFAAGISSAITAPLAAGLVATEVFNWKDGVESWQCKIVSVTIVIVGVVFAAAGWKPLYLIQLAQFANGLLLPVIVIILMMAMNTPKIMGDHRNNIWQNFAGVWVILITLFLGIKTLIQLFT